MKHASVGVCLILFALLSTATVAASHRTTTGTQLSMYSGNCSATNFDPNAKRITFPTGSDFFVLHGWSADLAALTPEEERGFKSSTTNFELYVDGVEQPFVKDFHRDGTVLTKLFLTNFPGGMTGTHILRGDWYIDGIFTGGTTGQSVLDSVCAAEVHFG